MHQSFLSKLITCTDEDLLSLMTRWELKYFIQLSTVFLSCSASQVLGYIIGDEMRLPKVFCFQIFIPMEHVKELLNKLGVLHTRDRIAFLKLMDGNAVCFSHDMWCILGFFYFITRSER